MGQVDIMTDSDETTSKQEDPQTQGGEAEVSETPEKPTEEEAVPLEEMTRAQLIEEIGRVQAAADENYDRYLRSEADLENAKKRFAREKSELTRFSNESLIKSLIPVLDNLEKAIEHAKDNSSAESLIEGVELTLKGFKDALAREGLVEVEAVGKPFDPNFHEAAREQESNDVPSGTVIESYQKGYLLNDRLVRPAMVVVSRNAS